MVEVEKVPSTRTSSSSHRIAARSPVERDQKPIALVISTIAVLSVEEKEGVSCI